MRSRSAPGFTLIELMVSMAMASVIATAAIASIMAIVELMKKTERQTIVDAEGKMLGEYLVARLQGLGGGSLRPWHGLALERGWSDGSDRLTFVELVEDVNVPECAFVNVHNDHLHGDTSACCFTPQHVGHQVIFSTQGGARWAAAYVTSVDTADCKLHFQEGVAGPDLDLDVLNDQNALANGWMAPVQVRRLWLDTATHQLKRDESTQGANNLSTVQALTDGIYDLQFALAYDVDPADGEIDDIGSGANDDEWLGNHASDQMGPSSSGRLRNASPEHLRMISVGLLVGAPVPGLGEQRAAVLDGPTRVETDELLRPVVGRAYLRNLNLYF